MELQAGVFSVHPADFPRVLEVWEASVRATHDFVTEADIQCFKPLVRGGLPHLVLTSLRDSTGQVTGFIAVAGEKIEMLFIDPPWRGHGGGARLIRHAVSMLGATRIDVNEQNHQALGFYTRMGFAVVGRSALDGTGKPFPLLHLRYSESPIA